MDLISDGRVGHAGTFNSNPIAVEAAAATLAELTRDGGRAYERLYATGRRLMEGLRAAAETAGAPVLVDGPGPVFQTYATDREDVRDYRDWVATDRAAMARLHALLLDRGVNVVGRGLWFLSTAHDDGDVDETVDRFADALAAW
jgi:glutamate-1-semialdehyde 2,1-aminomutase